MKSRVGIALLVLVVVSVGAASTGCDHGTISSGTAGLHMTFSPSPAYASRYETAIFSINKLQALPADPALAALYGNERLEFRFSAFQADLNSAQEVAYTDIALTPGTYNITLLELTPPTLADETIPLPSPIPNCIDAVGQLSTASPGVPAAVSFTDPPTLRFIVQPGQTRLALKLNFEQFIRGYEAAFSCVTPCGDPGSACVTGFDETVFRTVVQNYLTIE